MATQVHITEARRMMERGQTVKLEAWKADGSVVVLEGCVSLKYNIRGGWRNVKVLASGQIRRVRDVCIFRINDLDVYL